MVDLPLIGSWNLISQARQSSTATTKAEGEDMYVKEAVSEDERRDAGQTAGISGPSVGPLAPDDRARSWRRRELGPMDTPYTPTWYEFAEQGLEGVIFPQDRPRFAVRS